MPVVDVPGLGSVEFPDGMTNVDMEKAIYRTLSNKHGQMALEGTSALERGLIGAGKAFTDLGQGARQIYAKAADVVDPRRQSLSYLVTGKTVPSRYEELEREVAEKRAADSAVMDTTAGKVGNFAGNVAAAVPTMFIPGVNTYTGAGLIGASMGLLQPTGQGESKLANAALGTAAGLGGQAVGNVVSRLIRPVQSSLSAQEAQLAAGAARNNIPLTAGQATGSRPLQITESVLENLPFTSGPQLAIKEQQARAFNKAILSKAGIAGEEATAPVLVGQKQALGQQFQSIAGRNTIDFNKGSILSDLSKVASEGSRRLSNPQPLQNTIDDIINDAANGVMEGTKYQGWRETLGRLSRGNGSEAHYFGEVKKALDKAFSSQVSAADAQAWKQASRQYANLKTINNAMGGSGAGTKGGNIPPAQLEAALTQSVGREGKALGRGDLNELVSIGRKFVSDSVPNSGTAQRQFIQGLLTSAGGAGVGAGAAAATGNNPLEGAAYGLGAGAAGLLAPRAMQALINSPVGQAYLSKGLLSLTPAEMAAINALTRSGAAGSISYAGQ